LEGSNCLPYIGGVTMSKLVPQEFNFDGPNSREKFIEFLSRYILDPQMDIVVTVINPRLEFSSDLWSNRALELEIVFTRKCYDA